MKQRIPTVRFILLFLKLVSPNLPIMKPRLNCLTEFSRPINPRLLFTETSVFIFILLFSYAAFSKLITFRMFTEQLAQMPIIAEYSGQVAWLVPCVELFVCGLLISPFSRVFGVLVFTLLMLAFTFYVALMLAFNPHLPCICGGLISGLGWVQHLVFNMSFLLWGIILLVKFEKELHR